MADLNGGSEPETIKATATKSGYVGSAKRRLNEVTHLCPHGDNAVTPCCARLVLELPRSHRLTLDPKQVTCGA